MKITPRKKRLLDFINSYNRKHSFAPSIPEIAKRFNLAISTVHQHLEELKEGGHLKKEKNRPRGVEIATSEVMVSIPLLGTIAAGQPLALFDVPKETIAVPKSKIPSSSEVYALRVVGNSMIDENINDGDIILVRHQETAENGQKVVALIDNQEATLKKFYKERGHIRLQPANKSMEPLIFRNGRGVSIQGIVLDVIREEGNAEIKLPEYKEKEIEKYKELPLNKVVLGDAIIFHADCLNAFKGLQENSIDFIATDPPYFLDGMDNKWSDSELKKKEARAGAIRGLPVGMRFDPEQGKRLQVFFAQVSREALRVLKPGGFMVVFSQGRLFHRIGIAAEDAGFEARDMLIWEHNGGQGKAFTQNHFVKKMRISREEKEHIIRKLRNRKTPQLRPKFEAILLAQKPKQGTFVENWLKWETGLIKADFETQQTTIFNYKKSHLRKEIDHMTIKPVDLMERLIEVFSTPRQVVLDPFMGSGTTGVAALRNGRKFLGFEIEKKYFKIAEKRLEPISKIPPARVARDFIDPARREEEAVAIGYSDDD